MGVRGGERAHCTPHRYASAAAILEQRWDLVTLTEDAEEKSKVGFQSTASSGTCSSYPVPHVPPSPGGLRFISRQSPVIKVKWFRTLKQNATCAGLVPSVAQTYASKWRWSIRPRATMQTEPCTPNAQCCWNSEGAFQLTYLAWWVSDFTQVLPPVTLLCKESQPSQNSGFSDKRELGWTNPAVVWCQ